MERRPHVRVSSRRDRQIGQRTDLPKCTPDFNGTSEQAANDMALCRSQQANRKTLRLHEDSVQRHESDACENDSVQTHDAMRAINRSTKKGHS
jgi:hypothetical protein